MTVTNIAATSARYPETNTKSPVLDLGLDSSVLLKQQAKSFEPRTGRSSLRNNGGRTNTDSELPCRVEIISVSLGKRRSPL
jgi:hypothetical protein